MSNRLNIKSEPKTDSSDEKPIKSEPDNVDPTQPTQETPVKQEPSTQSPSKPAANNSQASGPPKRVFVPNLAVDRTKRETKPEPEQSRQDKSKQPRRPVAPNLGASRGRGRNQNLIQSHSIFEAGPSESTKRFDRRDQTESSYTRVVGSSDRSSSHSVKKEADEPSISRLKNEKNILIDDAIEDESPVYIKLKHEVKEEGDIFDVKARDETKLKDEKILKDIFLNQLDKNMEKLILFQIPEKLQLNELNEGHMGKIRIRKSGRIEMVINEDKLLNISLSVSAPFLQV